MKTYEKPMNIIIPAEKPFSWDNYNKVIGSRWDLGLSLRIEILSQDLVPWPGYSNRHYWRPPIRSGRPGRWYPERTKN